MTQIEFDFDLEKESQDDLLPRFLNSDLSTEVLHGLMQTTPTFLLSDTLKNDGNKSSTNIMRSIRDSVNGT